MADLAQLEEQIVGLSLLEAASLVKKLEERSIEASSGQWRRIRLVMPLLAMVGFAVQASADQPDRVSFRYDTGRFRPETSGQVEIRLRTPQAAQIMNLISTA
jgi:hypothetical protein